jgi:hypothetical protein
MKSQFVQFLTYPSVTVACNISNGKYNFYVREKILVVFNSYLKNEVQ